MKVMNKEVINCKTCRYYAQKSDNCMGCNYDHSHWKGLEEDVKIEPVDTKPYYTIASSPIPSTNLVAITCPYCGDVSHSCNCKNEEYSEVLKCKMCEKSFAIRFVEKKVYGLEVSKIEWEEK